MRRPSLAAPGCASLSGLADRASAVIAGRVDSGWPGIRPNAQWTNR